MVAQSIADIAIGQQAEMTVVFTPETIATFADLTGDRAPVHVDPRHAQALGFRAPIVHGCCVAAYFSGLLGQHLPGPQTVLHWIKTSAVQPVYADDTLHYQVRVKQCVAAVAAVILDLQATRVADGVVVCRGQAQCGFISPG